MEADFARYYNLDLLDLYRGRLSWRKFRVLTRALPRESSLVRADAGEPAEWGVTDYLLALVADSVNHLIYAYVASHSKGMTPKPKPVPRPVSRSAQAARERRQMSAPNEIAAFFGRGSVNVVRR